MAEVSGVAYVKLTVFAVVVKLIGAAKVTGVVKISAVGLSCLVMKNVVVGVCAYLQDHSKV